MGLQIKVSYELLKNNGAAVDEASKLLNVAPILCAVSKRPVSIADPVPLELTYDGPSCRPEMSPGAGNSIFAIIRRCGFAFSMGDLRLRQGWD